MGQHDDVRVLDQRADEDLMVAELIIDNNDELLEQIGFHLQQFVEKKMKVSLKRHNVDYPLTHDIARLLKLFPREKVSEDDKMFAYTLSHYAVESRYGEEPESPWDGQYMLDKAKKFVQLVESLWDDP